jgi:hypothetical protein
MSTGLAILAPCMTRRVLHVPTPWFIRVLQQDSVPLVELFHEPPELWPPGGIVVTCQDRPDMSIPAVLLGATVRRYTTDAQSAAFLFALGVDTSHADVLNSEASEDEEDPMAD